MEVNRTLRMERDQGEEGAEAIIQASMGNYDEIMELISGNYIPEEKFLRTHEVAMAAAAKYFKSQMNILENAPEVEQEIEADFNKLIEQSKINFLKENEKIFQKFNAKKQQILEQTLATFSTRLSQIVKQQAGLPQKLDQIRVERNEIRYKALEDIFNLDETTPQLMLAFDKELQAKLDEKVQDAKALMDQKIVQQAQRSQQVIQDAIDNFQNTVQILSEITIRPGSCSQALRTAKDGVMQNASTTLSQINTPNLQFYLDDLSNQVEALLAQALKENNAKHQVTMETLKNISESSMEEFQVAAFNIINRFFLGDTDGPSSLLKAENEALESFDSAVAAYHFPHKETDLSREELRQALENSRKAYMSSFGFGNRTDLSFDEILVEMHKEFKAREANWQKISERMEKFLTEFKERIKEIDGGAANAKPWMDSEKNSAMTDFRLSFCCPAAEERDELIKEFERKLDKVIEDSQGA